MGLRNYSFVDYATQAYCSLVTVLILLFHNATVPGWGWLVAANLTALLLVHGLIHWQASRPSARILDFLRQFYPLLLYTGFFCETGQINRMFISTYLDPLCIRLDQSLFGCQPSLLFMQQLPCLWLSELLHAAYFSYYLMVGGLGLALLFRNRRYFAHYVAVISFVFYLCYLAYIFLPAIGPMIFCDPLPGYSLPPAVQQLAPTTVYPAAVTNGLFYRLMEWIYRVFEAPGAALPSSHVAVALCTVYFSFRYLRPIRFVHLAVAVLLCLSTVYCRYHYAVDVLAGVLTAAILLPLGNWLYFKFTDSRAPAL